MNASALTALRGRRLCASAFCVTLGVLAASAAWAQIGNGPAGTTGRAGRAQSAPEKPPEPPPDAIPGAKPREPAAPATRASGDMQPTDALFDAINRGDIASARDALNRGADMNGVNILGMTPMELSVDLGRNDISFLLLSMRREDGGGRASGAPGADAPAFPPAGKTARAEKHGAPGKPIPARTAQATGIIPNKPVAAPKLFANDGGSPVPNAGFLGFDRSAAN